MIYRKPIGRPRTSVDPASVKALQALGRKITKQRAAEAALAEEIDATVAQYHAQGVPVLRIAEYTGLTPKTVRACLARAEEAAS